MRKTKIVATLGPSSNDVDQLKALIEAGISACRLNFSHGDYEEHGARIENMKTARAELNVPIPIILDTKGPEIRIKKFATGKVELVAGQDFMFTTDDIEGDNTKVSVTYEGFPKDLFVGATVLIDDGLIEMTVIKIENNNVYCKVVNGGTLGSRKGVNLPNVHINLPALTQKDIEDLQFGVKSGVDYIAASFIRSAKDVLEIKKVLEDCGGSDVHIISKIENRDGVDNIDEILEVTDGVMVARGDMGVEIPFEEVPLVQKMIIRKCIEKGKPVITATQMLNSMIENPRPTRAEVNDVAGAIFDFTDAIMLSGETANGDYPVEAVKAMDRIAREVEKNIDYESHFYTKNNGKNESVRNITSAMSHSACTTAHDLNAGIISTITISGSSVRNVAKYRPATPILACTPIERTLRQLNLIWGCRPMLVEMEKKNINTLFDDVSAKALAEGIVGTGELMVFTGGTPLGTTGTTNTIKVGLVGDILLQGKSAVKGNKVTSHTNIITSSEEAKLHFRKGDIFVTSNPDKGLIPYMMRAAALVVGSKNNDDFTHAIDLGRELKIPVLVCDGTQVSSVVPDNLLATIDSNKGTLSNGDK
ncbi:MAG TPA: pyruvate kinase [Lachnospiraceae bacterium]|nr:pyruvate kinase [Lachnospiraceae bacterium]